MKAQALGLIILLLFSDLAFSVTGRDPNGVNVKATGPTSVFITFQGTGGQSSTESFWCGELIGTIPGNGVFTRNPCVPGTLFGRLPKKLDQSRGSGTGTQTNLTDIMTIPTSVARRAYQSAQEGNNSSFFYVRKFSNGINEEFVVVTCRMAGGGARIPLALMKVIPYFETAEGRKPVTIFYRNEASPPLGAIIYYNGSGRLKGRWEIMRPGDPEPSNFDLLPESSLPVEERGLQKRYEVLSRFNIFLPPTGKAKLSGPSLEKIPTDMNGPYKILLRVESTKDKEGNSNTGSGTATSGGVSGFPMPVLRYYVGNQEEVSQARLQLRTGDISLLLPQKDLLAKLGDKLEFSWSEVKDANLFRLEIHDSNGQVLSALITKGQGMYTAPPWLLEKNQNNLKWRVIGIDKNGHDIAASEWRTIRLSLLFQ